MKKINFEEVNLKNGGTIGVFLERGVGMEFIKYGDKYILKNSPGVIVSEKEKLQMEKGELVLKDIEGCECQKDTTLKIREINKQLEEIDKKEKPKKKKGK